MTKEESEGRGRKRANLNHLLNQLAEQDDIIKSLIPRSAAWEGAPESLMVVLRNLFQEAANALPQKHISFNDNNDLDGLLSQISSLRGKAAEALTEIGEKPPQNPAPHSEQHPLEKMLTNTDQNVPDRRKVFVVVGRNVPANDALFQLLRSIDLDPMEWSEAVALTGTGSPYPGDVLEVGMSHCQAVIVFLTGDDMARLGTRFQKDSDEQHERELTPQCRPNVLFEAGMAFGRYPRRTIIVALAQTRPFSDTLGRHIVFLSRSPQGRHELANRLRTAGCAAKTDNRHNWMTDGDFEAANLPPDNSPILDLGNAKPTASLKTGASVKATLVLEKKSYAWDIGTYQVIFTLHDHLSIEINKHTDEKTGTTGIIASVVNGSSEWLNSFNLEIVDVTSWSEKHQKFLPNRNFGRTSFNKGGNLRPEDKSGGQWLVLMKPDGPVLSGQAAQLTLPWPNTDPSEIRIWRISLAISYHQGEQRPATVQPQLKGAGPHSLLVRWDKTLNSLDILDGTSYE